VATRYILLDSGPLGLACSDPSLPAVSKCLSWLLGLEFSDSTVLIPSICDYEVRRELLRVRAVAKLRRLTELRDRFELTELSSIALERAAEFWALLRQTGQPTAGDDALDGDAILAGMASILGQAGDPVVVATTNVKHLVRFPGIDARFWETIA
jgi:predicted nucleic acid-binding protein